MPRARAALVLLAGLCLSTSSEAATAVPKRDKPNIIFILADDLGIPGLSCYGGIYKTPNLDRLATNGTRFEHCFAAPLCGPSRAMLMTGRYAFRTGVTTNNNGASASPGRDGCVAQYLKQAGYVTGVFGKWRQLAHFITRADGDRWGFDEFVIWGAGLPDDDGVKVGKKESKAGRYWDPIYNVNGKKLVEPEDKYGPDALQHHLLDFI